MRKPKEVLQQSILANKLKRIMSETDYCPIDFLDSVKLNKSDVISSVCDCAVPSHDTDKFCCTVCDKELTEDD